MPVPVQSDRAWGTISLTRYAQSIIARPAQEADQRIVEDNMSNEKLASLILATVTSSAMRGYIGIHTPSPVPPMGLNGTWPGIAKMEKMIGLRMTNMVQILTISFPSSRDHFHTIFNGFGHLTKMEKNGKNIFQKTLSPKSSDFVVFANAGIVV